MVLREYRQVSVRKASRAGPNPSWLAPSLQMDRQLSYLKHRSPWYSLAGPQSPFIGGPMFLFHLIPHGSPLPALLSSLFHKRNALALSTPCPSVVCFPAFSTVPSDENIPATPLCLPETNLTITPAPVCQLLCELWKGLPQTPSTHCPLTGTPHSLYK